MSNCACANDDTSIKQTKLERLVKRLLARQVVPFLGAGVSYNAKLNDGSTPANTTKMIHRLKCRLEHVRSNGSCSEKRMARFLNNKSPTQQSMTNLSEMYLWTCGQEQVKELVCEVLMINRFTELIPTNAHRFIAFLARENLLPEVITTNYDTCLEAAYQDTFSPREVDEKDREKMAVSIASLNSYRTHGGKGQVTLNNEDYPCLKVYKINGCAKESLDGDRVQDILLTERQLQEWGERGWARDLFRDRVRSRCFVFSGFGSAEPQVRHTALQVAEEFFNTKRDRHSVCPWEVENSPFIIAFQNLSFHQCQILQAYIQSNSGCRAECSNSCWPVFGGDDLEFFRDGSSTRDRESEGLEADLFWKRVFQFTFWELLRLYCKPGKPAYELLSAAVAPSRALLQDMLEWLRPEVEPFGRFPELLDLDEDKHLLLSKWIWCIRYGLPQQQPGWYPSFLNRPVLLPFFFLVLYFLTGKSVNWARLRDLVSINNGILLIKVHSKVVPEDFKGAVILSHSDQAYAANGVVPAPQNMQLVQHKALVQIFLDRRSYRARRKRTLFVTGNGIEKVVNVRTVYQLPLLEMLRGNGQVAHSIGEVERNLRDALLAPSTLVGATRPSIRQRAKRIRDKG